MSGHERKSVSCGKHHYGHSKCISTSHVVGVLLNVKLTPIRHNKKCQRHSHNQCAEDELQVSQRSGDVTSEAARPTLMFSE